MGVPFMPPKPASIPESGLSEPLAKFLEARGSRHSGQAKRDPESRPAIVGIQAILDSRFRRLFKGLIYLTLSIYLNLKSSLKP
jgi:hypothetical protein